MVIYREVYIVNEGFDISDCYSLFRIIVRDFEFLLLLEYKVCNICLIVYKEFNIKYV